MELIGGVAAAVRLTNEALEDGKVRNTETNALPRVNR
jgi:hypothetical protein